MLHHPRCLLPCHRNWCAARNSLKVDRCMKFTIIFSNTNIATLAIIKLRKILALISCIRTWKLLLHTWMYSANMPKESLNSRCIKLWLSVKVDVSHDLLAADVRLSTRFLKQISNIYIRMSCKKFKKLNLIRWYSHTPSRAFVWSGCEIIIRDIPAHELA